MVSSTLSQTASTLTSLTPRSWGRPYAGVSTAILFFTKTGRGGTDLVWFYDMTADG